MKPKVLVIEIAAIDVLLQSRIESEKWFDNFSIPAEVSGLRLRYHAGVVLLSLNMGSPVPRVAVFKLEEGRLFDAIRADLRVEAFYRCLRAALSVFSRTVAIPTSWRPYHYKSRVSFQVAPKSTGDRARMCLDTRPAGELNAYFYEVDVEERDLKKLEPSFDAYQFAISNLKDAYATPAISSVPIEGETVAKVEASAVRNGESKMHLDLQDSFEDRITQGVQFQQWYDRRLSKRQREFVDASLTQSMRIRGAAGTGKTLTLVIKLLKSLYDAIGKQAPIRAAFITHSTATSELVRNLISDIDERAILYSPPAGVVLQISTLQEMANSALSYDLQNLQPLSSDGLEGRVMQMEIISSAMSDYRKSDWLVYKAGCSEPFIRYMEEEQDSPAFRYFCFELMNEFACVLDADGVRDSWERKAKYKTEKRRQWMMRLSTESERQVVLDLYAIFRKTLRDMNAIGADQMISDYLGYLDSFRWDVIRAREGFDVILVDELHLFNRQEQMLFHHLMRDSNQTPVILMAYDAKQSPRDTFVGLTAGEAEQVNFWRDAKLGEIKKFELVDVFRYTPQIQQALFLIDQSFPAVDLQEEWPPYSGISQIADGPIPSAYVVKDYKLLYEKGFVEAIDAVRELGKGKSVAILCLNAERFQIYIEVGKYREKFLPIVSREDISSINRAGKRFIVSMPEYVAGLQFDTVILMDVNQAEIPDSVHATGAKRRFVSNVYLGASRAERVLKIYATEDQGGLSEILTLPLNRGAISLESKTGLN